MRNWIVKIVKIHSHTNLKLTSSNLHHSPKQHDEHLFNSHSSKKKKKLSSGTGSALSNTGGQDKLPGTMYSGRSGPQVRSETLCFNEDIWSRVLHRWIIVLLNIAIELKKNLVYYNNNAKGKELTTNCFGEGMEYFLFSLKFDCEKLAQEKIEVHRQYVMVKKGKILVANAFTILVLRNVLWTECGNASTIRIS